MIRMPIPNKALESEEWGSPSNNLWVGNLAAEATDADLMDLFAQYGALDSVTTYSSRSYAFVFFKRVEDAKAAKSSLQGTPLRGIPIRIEFARPVCTLLCSTSSLLHWFYYLPKSLYSEFRICIWILKFKNNK